MTEGQLTQCSSGLQAHYGCKQLDVLCALDPCRYLERPKVTANVVDIESDGQTVLHAADVSELGEGMVEVTLQSTAYTWRCHCFNTHDGSVRRCVRAGAVCESVGLGSCWQLCDMFHGEPPGAASCIAGN